MNTEQSPYQIIPLIHASGERLPCLVERAGWLPLRLANRWAVRYRRYRVQSSTLTHNLHVIAQIYSWADQIAGLDLDNYLIGGSRLTARQIESLAVYLRSSQAGSVVRASTYNNRLTIAENFLIWALYPANRGGGTDLSLDQLMGERDQLRLLFESLRMRQGASPRRQPLSETAIQTIRRLLKPIQQSSQSGQFSSIGFSWSVALRNWLMVEVALQLGLRRGEILKLRLDSLPRGAGDGIRIRRLPDDPADSRQYEPAVKTAERMLPAGRQLLEALRIYVISQPPSGRVKGYSPYLFVTRTGQPLSLDAARDILRVVRRKCDIQPLSWHRFRHTWAEQMADKLLDQPNGLDRLMYLGGWTHPASPQRYIANALAQKAGDSLRLYQESLYRTEVDHE
jgi:integrase